MRVTQSMLTHMATTYLMRDLERLQRVQQQITTGRNYTLPSENPVAATQIVHLGGTIAETTQYRSAIDSGLAWNEMTSTVLSQVEELLSDILNVSQGVSSSAVTSDERLRAAEQINSLLDELVMAANRTFRDKYLFGGDETLTVPFTARTDASGDLITGVAQSAKGIDGTWGYLVSEVDTVVMNTPGNEVFQPSGEGADDDVFQAVVRLRQALENQDFSAMALEEGRLSQAIAHVTSVNSSVGDRINRLESLGQDLDAMVLNYTDQRSTLEDTDMSKAIVEFNTAENVYQAALASTARILQLSLVDFI
jgi:flagellar hook-associated protein 3 FlgL